MILLYRSFASTIHFIVLNNYFILSVINIFFQLIRLHPFQFLLPGFIFFLVNYFFN